MARIRFELQSLAALGVGPHRLPINCWRLTVQFQGTKSVLIDGQDYNADLLNDPAANTSHLAQFTVGGVVLPNGQPLNLDQILTVTVPVDNFAQGVITYEYYEL